MEIRRMESHDIEDVTVLCEQFGYPARTEEVKERFQHLCHLPEHELSVAEDNSTVAGWIHVHGMNSLSSPPYAEIRGIVVDRTTDNKALAEC